MKIALAQLRLTENIQENLNKAISSMEVAAKNGAKLISFPEIQLSPFFPQYNQQDVSGYEVSLDSEAIHLIQKKCAELNLVAIPNVYLNEKGRKFDASPVIDSDGQILGVSKMVHIVQAEKFFEKSYYAESDTGFITYDTAVGKIGVVICFDRHYPESIRSCVLAGADLIIIPTANTKDEPLEYFEWELRVPAVQNSVFIAMCNRVGKEDNLDFCGNSIVIDPNGDILVKADDQEQIVYADVEMSIAKKIRAEKPYMKLRRPEMYN